MKQLVKRNNKRERRERREREGERERERGREGEGERAQRAPPHSIHTRVKMKEGERESGKGHAWSKAEEKFKRHLGFFKERGRERRRE